MALKHKPVALVTGGTSGIGLAILHRFAQDGYQVVFCGRNQIRGKKAESDLLKKYGLRSIFVRADVGLEEDLQRIMDQGPGRLKRLDVLCNNAGIQRIGSIEKLTPADWDEVMAVNTRSAFILTRMAVPYLKKTRGCIVNVASTGGLVGYSGGSAYCVSKSALIMLTKVFALELAPWKIRANCVCPGAVNTPMVPSRIRKRVASQIPLGRVGLPKEVAELVHYLASPRAKQITGAAFVMDGGVTAGRARLAE